MGVESLVGVRPLLENPIFVRLHHRNRARHRAARLHFGHTDLIQEQGDRSVKASACSDHELVEELVVTEADPVGFVSSGQPRNRDAFGTREE
jgi:hypothetical protein